MVLSMSPKVSRAVTTRPICASVCGEEAGEDLLLAGQHAPLVRRMVVPSPDPFGSCCQFGARRDHAACDLTVEETLRQASHP